MDQEHSQYSPSRLKQIMECPGSVSLTEKALALKRITLQQNAAAKTGSDLHAVLDKFLTEHNSVKRPLTTPFDDVLLLDAMEYFFDEVEKMSVPNLPRFEDKVTLAPYGIEEVYGTADAWMVDQDCLHVFDWKFGRWPVKAYENPQLMAYGYGALARAYELHDWLPAGLPIQIHIVQPQISNFQSWRFNPDKFWLDKVKEAIELSKLPQPPFNPDKETCRWCPCCAICSPRLGQVDKVAAEVFQGLETVPELWTDEQVKDLLGKIEPLTDTGKQIMQHFEDRLRMGHKVPGYKLAQGQGRRHWVDEDQVAIWFEQNYPDVEIFDVKLRTPADLEKSMPSKERKRDDFLELIGKSHSIKMVKDYEQGEDMSAEAVFAGLEAW